MRRIATHLAIDYLRSADRFSAEPCEPTTRPADPGLLLQRELSLRKQIEKAFSLLPARLRVTATLALVEELPYSEIAEALGISLSAVKMRVARAMQTLRKSLERIGIQP